MEPFQDVFPKIQLKNTKVQGRVTQFMFLTPEATDKDLPVPNQTSPRYLLLKCRKLF